MWINRPWLPLIALLALTACAHNETPSLTPSLAQIKTLVPTVNCAEDAPDDPLPDYPAAPGDQPSLQSLFDFSRAQSNWAAQAIGVYRRERAKRAATARCIAELRERGLIN